MTLVRKAVVSVKKDRAMFFPEQLTKVVALLMENLPYILFRPKEETKDHVLLLFSVTNQDNSACEAQINVVIIKQELLSGGFQLRFNVKNLPALPRKVLYLANNYQCLKALNDDICHLPPDNHKQLVSFLKLLREPETAKKRRIDFVEL